MQYIIKRETNGNILIDNGSQADIISAGGGVQLSKKGTKITIRVFGGNTYVISSTDGLTINDVAVVSYDVSTVFTNLDQNVFYIAGGGSGSGSNVNIVSALPAGGNVIGGVNVNNPLPAGTNMLGLVRSDLQAASGNITTQNLVPAGAATAGSAVEIALNGANTLITGVLGTYTGALSIQLSMDGTNWQTVTSVSAFKNLVNGTQGTTIASAQVNYYSSNVSGFLKARITGLAAMTGAAAILLRAVEQLYGVAISDTQIIPGIGSTALGKSEDQANLSGDVGLYVLGVRRDTLAINTSANGDYGDFATDQYGAQLIRPYEKQARTYSLVQLFGTNGSAIAATPGDILIIPGNASNTVYITRIIISGTMTTAGMLEILLAMRSAVNSGGTSSAATVIRHAIADAATSSAPLIYTANPTTGTLHGNVRRQFIQLGTPTAPLPPTIIDFGDKGKQITLSGVAQGLALNLNGVALPAGLTLDVVIEYLEI